MKFSEDGAYLIAAIGQEHKLGRWSISKNAKNTIAIIKLNISDNQNEHSQSETTIPNKLNKKLKV